MNKFIFGIVVFAVVIGFGVTPALADHGVTGGHCDDPAGPGVDCS